MMMTRLFRRLSRPRPDPEMVARHDYWRGHMTSLLREQAPVPLIERVWRLVEGYREAGREVR